MTLGSRWHMALPIVMRLINSVPNATTNISPAQLLFGSAVGSPTDRFLLSEPQCSEEERKTSAYKRWRKVVAVQDKMSEVIKKKIDKDIEQRVAKQPPPEERTTYEVGDLLLSEYPHNVRPSKLQPHLMGPYQVIGRQGERSYILRHLGTQAQEVIDVDRLRRYEPDPSVPEDAVAQVDDDDSRMGIDTVISHRCEGNARRKQNFQFKIRWKDGTTSWATYASVKDTSAVRMYVADAKVFD